MTPRLLCTLALGLVLGLAAAGPGLAQSSTDDQVEKRIKDLDKQVRQLREIVTQARDTGQPVQVHVSNDPDPALESLRTRLDDLEQAARARNDQIDTLAHDVDIAKRDATTARDTLRSLEERLAKAEARLKAIDDSEAAAVAAAGPASPLAGSAAGAPPPSAPDGGAGDSFQRARKLLNEGQYAAASGAFQNFIESYGDTPDGPEARYWLGETLYIRGLYADAATAYIGSIRGWPQTNWAPNAVVKLAKTLIALNQSADACKTLGELGRRYPMASPQSKEQAAGARAAAKCS